MNEKYAVTYIGAQVMLTIGDNTMLGDVKNAYNMNGETYLIVKYFNGTPWPFDPKANAVTEMIRFCNYEDCDQIPESGENFCSEHLCTGDSGALHWIA